MIYIAHRGNVDGPIPHHENTPAYIDDAIFRGFDVEVDLWGEGEELFLGHDAPSKQIDFEFIHKRRQHLWIHCKNSQAITLISSCAPNARYFFHQKDDYTIVSNGIVWCYPGKLPPPGSVVLLPEIWMNPAAAPEYCKHHGVFGVCSDFVGELKKA